MRIILSDSPFELMALYGTSELRPLEEESDTYPSNPRQMLLSKPTPLPRSLSGGSANALGGVEVRVLARDHGIIPTRVIENLLVSRLARKQKIGVYAASALSRT